MFTDLAIAIYLQVGFQKWEVAMARGVLLTSVKSNISHRAAFLGGAMHGQFWSGPASANLRADAPAARRAASIGLGI